MVCAAEKKKESEEQKEGSGTDSSDTMKNGKSP
jgi:hypothetical protein